MSWIFKPLAVSGRYFLKSLFHSSTNLSAGSCPESDDSPFSELEQSVLLESLSIFDPRYDWKTGAETVFSSRGFLRVSSAFFSTTCSLDGSTCALDGTATSLDGTATSLDGTTTSLDGTTTSLDGTTTWVSKSVGLDKRNASGRRVTTVSFTFA